MKRQAGRRRGVDVAFYMPWIGPLLTPGAEAPPGGAETQILLLARELVRRQWRVALITYEIGERLPSELDGIRIFVQRKASHRWRVVRVAGYLAETARVLKRVDAGTYAQRSAGTPTGLVGLQSRLLRRRFVYSSANVVDFDFGRLEPNRRNLALYHLGVRLADEIVVQTAEQVELCRRRFGRSPAMIKSIGEPAEARTGVPEAFLWIGRMAHYKRPEVYVKLARAVPEASFWLVAVPAGGFGEVELRELQRDVAGVRNLTMLSPRPRRDLMKLIHRAVAVVNTADYEGMPNIFLEGWARGVPALAFTHDPDGVVQRYGLGAFAEGSEDRLAALTRGMWEQRSDQSAVAHRCRAYIEREHSLAAVADAWEIALGLSDARLGTRVPPDVEVYNPLSGRLEVGG